MKTNNIAKVFLALATAFAIFAVMTIVGATIQSFPATLWVVDQVTQRILK